MATALNLMKGVLVTLIKKARAKRRRRPAGATGEKIYVHVSKCKQEERCCKSSESGPRIPEQYDEISDNIKAIQIFAGELNEVGKSHLSGEIELTVDGLIFHPERGTPTSWSVRTITRCGTNGRRFAFETETWDYFTDEKRRRYFVFQCDQGERIFQILTGFQVVESRLKDRQVFLYVIEH